MGIVGDRISLVTAALVSQKVKKDARKARYEMCHGLWCRRQILKVATHSLRTLCDLHYTPSSNGNGDAESRAAYPLRQAAHLSGGIYDRDELLQVSAEEPVVEGPVLVFQALQKGVLADRSVARGELVVRAAALLLERVDAEGEAPGETEGLALCDGECGALVEARVGEDGVAAQCDTQDSRCGGRHCGDGGGEAGDGKVNWAEEGIAAAYLYL